MVKSPTGAVERRAGAALVGPHARRAEVAEAKTRAALHAFVAGGEVERWIGEQRLEPIPSGWRVRERFQGWRFRVEPVAGGVRIVMSVRGGEPAAWTVPA